MTDDRRDQLAEIKRVLWQGTVAGTEERVLAYVDRMIRQAQAEARIDELGRAVTWARGRGVFTRDQFHLYSLDRAAALRATTDHVAVTDAHGAAVRPADGLGGAE